MSKLLIGSKDFFIKDDSKDFHTQFGIVKKEDLVVGNRIKIGKEEFTVLNPDFIDLFRRIRRGPQIITPKDAAFIIAETGINQKSVVVDAGAGSGGLSLFLAHHVKKVTCYDIRDDFLDIVRENVLFLGLKNVVVKKGDIYSKITEKNLDLLTLDVPEPWRALSTASKVLKPGAFLVSYSPNITQTKEMSDKAGQFLHIRTTEVLVRDWNLVEKRSHPHFEMLGHTGFISVYRKV